MRVVLAALALVAGVHASLWFWSRETAQAPAAPNRFTSLSFAPFAQDEDAEDVGAKAETIRADLDVIAPVTDAIRTYSSTTGLELVPPLAAEKNLQVTLGIWIDKDEVRNKREIDAAVDLASRNSNVKGIVVGNETILRADKSVQEMIDLIREVKGRTDTPVTTGEIWNTWLDHPELASAVDFLAVHILPYWEGIPADQSVDYALGIYEKLRAAFPGKHIVIAEFGWPSSGFNRNAATTGEITQAEVIREFTSRAKARGIDYNIVEAIDQPWKGAIEGNVGPYWGVFDASRHAKFNFSGPIEERTFWPRMIAAMLMGFLLSLPVLKIRGATFVQALVLVGAANGVGAWTALMLDHWLTHYFVLGAQIAMGVGSVLLVPLVIVILTRIEEISAIAFGRKHRRLIEATLPAAHDVPKVSIHVPAYREPPDMLIKTLNSVAALDYPNFECVVIVNNTPDPAFWMPIEAHCKELGERFKFLNAERIEGFKAGALRLAMKHTADDAAIIGVIDADYVVAPNWLKDLVPAFGDPRVGIVQAPQDHRDADTSVLHTFMNSEYAGFFDIGMVERNEQNAIIIHGTMCLMRRSAMDDAGGWSSDTICEDSDLGLAILKRGWQAHYTRTRYGWGLLPNDYDGFRKQRHRWTFGGMQIVTKHLGTMLRGGDLTPDQRRTYIVGWLNWMGAETVGVVIAVLNLIWVPIVVFGNVQVPEAVLTVPILAGFFIYLIHFMSLYRLRVKHSLFSTIGAAFAAMALQLTVARAVGEWVVKQHMAFIRTAKGGKAAKRSFPAFWEAILGGLLLAGAALVFFTNYHDVFEIHLFSAVLLVQSLPFLAASAIAGLERTPLNDLAFTAKVGDRIIALIERKAPAALPPTLVPEPVAVPAPVPVSAPVAAAVAAIAANEAAPAV
ncbi:glycosyl transferase family 2 [Terrihabitans soli]|uniref:Beta-monoglucosyldiacylglycerol synthase n=1 Tax=Terrihabitans soli TaxID=708113 RepID=A0A6S6QKQ3_9HYPH|nr:glycosyltransferase [Terrihabitans soli]BCJ90934.1 glycosyl transferase family 2 [Terrihabitans soli]